MTIPKPLPVHEESLIEMKRELNSIQFKEHREKYTKLGEQIINLSEIEIKRIRAGDSCLEYRQEREILCGFPSSEHYRKMGEVHTQKHIRDLQGGSGGN